MTDVAEQRLEEGGWGSGLSTAELAAVRAAGFQPAGLVMGSSVYSVAPIYGPGFAGYWTGSRGFNKVYYCPHGYGYGFGGHQVGVNWEQYYYEQGIEEAYHLAHGRLVAEAADAGAHGVVGVRLRFRRLSASEAQVAGQAVEFTAIGTAVKVPGAALLEHPFTSHLSGQELRKLISSGLVPAGLVVAVGAVQVAPGCEVSWSKTSLSNIELTQYSEALEQCRDIAVRRLEGLAGDYGEGVVGVQTDLALRGSRLAEMMLIGTVVRRFGQPEADSATPLAIMKLRDR